MPFVYNEKDRHYKGIPDVPIVRDWNDLPEEERKRAFEEAERSGFVAPRKDGVLTELKQGAAYGGLGVLKGLGATLEEATGYSGMKEYFGDVMRRNQQYNPDPSYKALSLDPANIARTIGSGAAQSTLSLGGAVVGGVLGGGVGGVAASTAMMFGQIYGDRVQEYREAYPNQDKGTVQGLAFFSALGESLIESVIGPEQLATGIAKKWATGALKETTKELAKKAGKDAAKSLFGQVVKEGAKNFVTEGLEEVSQDYWDRICRMGLEEQGIQLPSWEEVGETFFGGAWSGLALGGLGGAVDSMTSRGGANETTPAKNKGITPEAAKILPKTGTDLPAGTTVVNPVTGEPAITVTPSPSAEAKKGEETISVDPAKDESLPASVRLAASVAKELGIKVRYFDEATEHDDDMDIADGWFDEKNGEIWLNRVNPKADIMENLGHEFKHFLDKEHGDLVSRFNELMRSGMNETGTERMNVLDKAYEEQKKQVGQGFSELSADTFGQFWTDTDFWRDVATRAEKMEAGMGQKLLQALEDFIKTVRKKLKEIGTPEAKAMFDNFGDLREEAVKIMAEIKRQNGATETRNVVDVTGSGNVQSIPVNSLKLDPARFQFKSKADKKTGVDASEKLGGEWNEAAAGTILVWEDKNGNRFVVNGHHRFQLAKDKGVKNINAIVRREADGVSAEDAKREGIIINIVGDHGDVRDYADFVRHDKMSEEEAKRYGITNRPKGRTGFTIGHYASDNLYDTYRNEDITDTQAATIAEIAKGNTSVENAGIRAAKKGMSIAQMREYLKLLSAMHLAPANEETGDLFGGLDDNAIKISEDLSAKALEHINELKGQINASKGAIKNPDKAKKGGVSVSDSSQDLLDKMKQQLQEWENWQTNKKLFDQLLRETGHYEDVVGKSETKPSDEGRFNPDSDTPLLTPEEDANDFTLTGQTPEEAKADEKEAEQREAAERERADQQSKRDTPELPMDEQKPQSNFLDDHIIVTGVPPVKGAEQQGGSSWGANNTIVKTDAYEEARKRLKDRMRRSNVGMDPGILYDGAIVAVYHIEAGARKFADFANRMITDIGEEIKPFLKGLYENARRYPGMENIAKDMDRTDYVDNYNLDNIGKEEVSEDAISKELRDVINLPDVSMSVKQNRLQRLAQSWNMSIKEVQERCEAEVVKIAREINERNISDKEKYEKLVALYNRQPNFSNRTSTSMINQAYSTPVPLAWLLGKRIGLANLTVYEPTAGTGMLTVAGTPNTIDVNEINDLRTNILKKQGFNRVTSNDASKNRPNKQYDRVIMNPPFGQGAEARYPGFKLTKLDHVIAARALEAMKPDGRAAIIVGANTDRNNNGRASIADHTFMNYLYSNYNVRDNYIMSGDMYRKQGASYPVRIITIEGKKSQNSNSTHPTNIENIDSWDKLYNKLEGELTNELPETGRSDNGVRVERPNDRVPDEQGQPAENEFGNSRGDQEALAENSEESVGGREGERGGNAELGTGSTGSNRTGEANESVVSETSRPGNSGFGVDGNRTETVSGSNTESEERTEPENGSGVQAERPGNERSERGGIESVGQSDGSAVQPGELTVGEKRGELNNAYNAASNAPKMDVVIPSFLAQETESALQRLQEKVGDIDDFVCKELGYDSKDELYECLADVQVDSVAMAIDALKNGSGFIIGDQTGIGKGRQCAAIMRWAKKNGRVPIFFTRDAKLFSDMYAGDLKDIHTSLNPILVGDPQKAKVVDMDGNVLLRPPANKDKLKSAFKSLLGKNPEYDSVFITYSQVKNKNNDQQNLIRSLIQNRNCVVIMDEAHEAAGSTTNRKMSNLANFFFGRTEGEQGSIKSGILLSDVGVVYSSATFAKRPDTMGLYAVRTKIKDAVGKGVDLVSVLKRGGVALQQIISKGVAEVGQYIRRERDFTGVTFEVSIDNSNREDVEERYDRVAYVLDKMIQQSNLIRDTIKDALGDQYGNANTNEDSSVETASFSSVCHNYISQLLLASKCGIVIDAAEKAFKNGQKPVIAVDNTMESALKNYIEDNNLNAGDPCSMLYSDILENALMRMYSYSIPGNEGESIKVSFNPEEFGLGEAHEEMLKLIHELDDIELPVSPIDYIKNELEKRGIKCGELTGRDNGVDYSTAVPTLQKRSASSKDKNKNVNDFNAGKTDALILNRSGSTGLSLHASVKFKDQRQRHMIMAQPSLDIAIVQQIFGRVLRSGQVTNPEYTILSSFLASEKRVMMVLSRKLQSLNANTTANNKSSVNLGTDFLNKYGDAVAEEFLRENTDLQGKLGIVITENSETEDLMKRLTGKLAILPNEQQEQIYDELTDRYNNLVDFLKKTGNYDLEMSVHEDWDVITNAETELVPGNKNATLFDQPVTMKRISIKEQRQILAASDVQKEIDENIGGTKAAVEETLEKEFAQAEKDIAELEKQYEPGERTPEFIRDRKILLRDALRFFRYFIRNNANQMLTIKVGDDEYTGIITGFHRIGKYSPRSPFVASSTIVDFAVSDSVGRLSIPFSKFRSNDVQYSASTIGFNDAFTGDKQTVRVDRVAFTGNLLRAIAISGGGKVVSYKTNDGKVENALLMSRNYNGLQRDPRAELNSVDDVFKEIKENQRNPAYLFARDGAMLEKSVTYDGIEVYELAVPRSKRSGDAAKYIKDTGLIAITGDFESRGRYMRTNPMSEKDARRAIKYMMDNDTVFQRTGGRSYKLVEPVNSVTENDSPETISAEANNRHFKLVTDKKLIKKLDSEDYITTYRTVQIIGDKLYPPMAAKINGKWDNEIVLGVWEQSVEHPELAKPKKLKSGKIVWKFNLNKGNGKSIDGVDYNPYIHSSPTPLNDQFSEAFQRPNLVTIELRIPKSELTSGYHAEKAADPVGMKDWNAGIVQKKLTGTREVMLSRWAKPVRIVPDSEVAKIIYDMVRGKVNDLPSNVLTPSLRAELEKLGVPIAEMEYRKNESGRGGKYVRVSNGRKYKLDFGQQVNPIRVEGDMKESYQDKLDNYTYTVRGQRIVNNDAGRMIAGFGGINGTIKAILNGDFKPMSDTAQRAMQVIINSDEAQKLSEEDGKKLADVWSKYMESGSALGQALAARRIGAFDYTNMDSIRAHINAFLLKMGKAKAQTLRDDVLKKTGIDIDKLPDDIVTNPRKLDEVLRVMLSDRASLGDKFYEYWINSILSSPTTHVANTIGNVANAAYELGVKRIAEAMIGSVARALGKNVKNAATFGEYKQMMKAIDWKDAWRRARFMFDVETLDTNSRFDMAHAAIGGKIGRAVRVPGRLLRAADEFAKAVVVPVEAAAYAYREGAGKGYSGKVLQNYIEDQLQDENSDANAWGKQRSLELTFQERGKPGSAVNYLIQLKESGGIAGNIMKYVLPFIKTPHNILRQGIRKSPLGVANLAWQTYKGIRGKRAFDAEYVSLAAEQLLAWGVVMALAGDGDDDEPIITGSSPRYGSAEQRFKANKLPPYSIKIGDNYYSYQRIEPLATGLAFIADGIQAYKAAKRGEDGQKIMSRLLGETVRMVSDKSFLEGLGKIQKFVEDPDRSLKKEMTDFFASWSPNAVRHTINMFDDNVRDNRARDKGMNWFEDQFYVTMNAAGYVKASPKYDYFGRPVKKDSLADSGPLWQMMRLVPIKSVNPDENMNRAEKLMWKYNMTHPGAEYYPDVPAYYFQRDGQKLYTTGKYWDEFAQRSGQLALKQINNAFKHGLLNERKPTEKDIELIKKIFQRARKEVRDDMYEKKHYQK